MRCRLHLQSVQHAQWSMSPCLVTITLVRGSLVWNPITAKDSMRIELIQRPANKFIAGPEMDYTSRLIFLHLESLESHCHVKDLTAGYKYLNGFIDVNTHHFTPSLSSRTRSQHNQKLQLHFCRINSYKFSLFNRVVSAWNSIPSCIVNTCNPKQFRTRLLSYYSRSG